MLLKARVVVVVLRVEQAEVVRVERQAVLEASAPADQHKEHHKEDYQLERFPADRQQNNYPNFFIASTSSLYTMVYFAAIGNTWYIFL
jgi:hypothetical protein